MSVSSNVLRGLAAAICVALAAEFTLAGCGSQGPSIKQRADEAALRKKQNKEEEDFARSLPPTQAKPVYKP
jgi:predicted small lipoprotein YifL